MFRMWKKKDPLFVHVQELNYIHWASTIFSSLSMTSSLYQSFIISLTVEISDAFTLLMIQFCPSTLNKGEIFPVKIPCLFNYILYYCDEIL